ncbi:transglutaminase family protein [Deinococcus taklimakanensis]|uniref:Transglutaminase family protein n=1 Tax=Deinococcus taklimakanensis TaxID=536443 RepID=A0ABW5P4R5_9DEIO
MEERAVRMSATPVLEGPTIDVRVGCHLGFDVGAETPMWMVLEVPELPTQHIVSSQEKHHGAQRFHKFKDLFGNTAWRILTEGGHFSVENDLVVRVSALPDPQYPDLPKTRVEDLPDDVLPFLLPSRYIDSDLLIAQAWDRFGTIQGGWAQVQAICDHLHDVCTYSAGSNSSTTAYQAYQSGLAVCRDFAHMGITFCRALNFPARYAYGYLGDIDVPASAVPMDFHAWFEVWIDGAWRTFDARHNVPRVGRVLIATGRDAADVAFSTTFGAADLSTMRIWADKVSPEMQDRNKPSPEARD